jgi:O-antigen ligase
MIINKYKFKLDLGFIPLFVYYVFVFLSTSYSKYHDIALNGFIDRFEGFWVITCYIVLCFIAAHFITYEKDIKLLLGALLVCAALLCLLGISQFFGFDFLQTGFMKKAMLPADSQSMSDQLTFKFPTRYIYLTLFNPNYVGSFCAMVLPIAVVILLFAKKNSTKIFSGILCAIVLINAIGCRSSAGFAGIFVSVIILIILLRKRILKFWIPILGLLVCCAGLLIFLNYSYSNIILNGITKFLPQKQVTVYKDNENKPITNIAIDKNIMTLRVGDNPINLSFNSQDKSLGFKDASGKDVNVVKDPSDSSRLTFNSPKYLGLALKMNKSLFEVSSINTKFYITIDNTGSFKFLNQTGKPDDIVNPDSYGFEGYERWASSRGYIWSRSIPLLKDTIALGHGPDTFAAYFPQNDYNGKLNYLDTPYILVDKPHNIYLQMALNTGIVSLIAFLVFIFWYIIRSFKLYFKPKKDTSFYYMAGSACVISVIGFLVAGFANDSNINISPIFWILLGIGFACNRLYQKELAFDSAHEIAKQKKASKK